MFIFNNVDNFHVKYNNTHDIIHFYSPSFMNISNNLYHFVPKRWMFDIFTPVLLHHTFQISWYGPAAAVKPAIGEFSIFVFQVLSLNSQHIVPMAQALTQDKFSLTGCAGNKKDEFTFAEKQKQTGFLHFGWQQRSWGKTLKSYLGKNKTTNRLQRMT